MTVTLIVVMGSQGFAYIQTLQIAPIKYVQFFVYKLYLSKTVFSKKLEYYLYVLVFQLNNPNCSNILLSYF